MTERKTDQPARTMFVGRHAIMITLTDFCVEMPVTRASRKVIALTGVGGQGKSQVLERLARSVSATGKLVLRLDFDISEHRDPVGGLLHLRQQLNAVGHSTPHFDLAYARFYSFVRPGRDIRQDHPELFVFTKGKLGDFLGLAWDVIVQVPGGGIVKEVLGHASTAMRHWWHERGDTLLQELATLSLQELRCKLPDFLALDFARIGPGEVNLLVDTFEALRRSGVMEDRLASGASDEWLRKLIDKAPAMPIVIAGRSGPLWKDYDPQWATVITEMPLDRLSKSEVNSLLDMAEVRDEGIRKRVHALSGGHPLTLQILLRIYGSILNKGGNPTPEDLPSFFPEMLDRVLNHLDGAHRTIIKVLSVVSSVDQATWEAMASSGFAAFDSKAPTDVLDDVLFVSKDAGRFALHELVREQITIGLEKTDPGLLRRARRAAFRHVDSLINNKRSVIDRDELVREAAALLRAVDVENYPDWFAAMWKRLGQTGVNGLSDLLPSVKAANIGSVDQALAAAEARMALDPWSEDAGRNLAEALDGLATGRKGDVDALANLCVEHAWFVHADPLLRINQMLIQPERKWALLPLVELRVRTACGDTNWGAERALELLAANGFEVSFDLCRCLAEASTENSIKSVVDAIIAGTASVSAANSVIEVLHLFDGLAFWGGAKFLPGLSQILFETNNNSELISKLDNFAASIPFAQICFRNLLLQGAISIGDVALSESLNGGSEPVRILPRNEAFGYPISRTSFDTPEYYSLQARSISNEPQTLTPNLEGKMSSSGIRVEFAINDLGEAIIFHNMPLFHWRNHDRVYFRNGILIFTDVRASQPMLVSVTRDMQKYLRPGVKFLFVLMNEQMSNPVVGVYAKVFYVSN